MMEDSSEDGKTFRLIILIVFCVIIAVCGAACAVCCCFVCPPLIRFKQYSDRRGGIPAGNIKGGGAGGVVALSVLLGKPTSRKPPDHQHNHNDNQQPDRASTSDTAAVDVE
ncbi:unnamed protein product [Vitrella brassicaformis CCMP3155]|uniref:Uncharacterized protein n=1 Tax=Vitrella brassicaformis (strain CCMP3155) TaxID=1169540 RepID=A0A0G4FQ51_VITBC|nr:unnamed protein product [Vitrella brassicaformis CCMP3155]|eukprot:CEM16415.1 unnamed protein product [Vitrella brassicaformis CCMP3155]